jgi:hypothetical protein
MATLPRETFGFKQRACYWGSELVTFNAIMGASIFGVIGEVRHKPPEWRQGLEGFGQQAGSRYVQGMVKSTATFLVSTLSREDPRPNPPPMARLSPGANRACAPATSIKGRLGQSLLRVVYNACDNHIAPGRLIGSFASGFVGLAWAPPSQNKISSALVGSGTAFGGYIGNSVFSEFQNDLFGLLGKMFPAGKPQISKMKPTPKKEDGQ